MSVSHLVRQDLWPIFVHLAEHVGNASPNISGAIRPTDHVGVTELDQGLHAYADHTLPMGVIQRSDFSWEVHDNPALVIQFPLEAGVTWVGEEEGQELQFTSVATTIATPWGEMPAIEALGVTEYGPGIGFVYLPAIRNFASYSKYSGDTEPYATATWISNGTGATEATVVESDDAFATFDGLPPPGRVPEPDTRVTFEVPASATHVMLACFIGGEGIQQVHVVSPTGATLSCQRAPPMPTSQALITARREAEAGAWTVRTAVAGGWLYLEVYALTLTEETV